METGGVEAQCRKPFRGSKDAVRSMSAKPAASLCVLPVRVGNRESRAPKFRAKAMEAAKSLEAQP